jgi:hypothetical protein
MSKKPSHVSQASYPITQPLASILQTVITSKVNFTKDVAPNIHIQKESVESGFEKLIRNCFVAIDDVYFATPASRRNKESFQHRLAIRIATNEHDKTLTITDLGSGMTRADLINSLGIGSRLSSRAIACAKKLGTNDVNDENSSDDDSDTQVSDSSSDESDLPHQDIAEMDVNDNVASNESVELINVTCLSEDIGGFYSALVALGHEVAIGTKVSQANLFPFQLERDVR